MYAQGRYVEELDLGLASKYYFQTQSNPEEDDHYLTIYAMLVYLEILSSLLYAFLCLTTYTWIFPAFGKSKKDLKGVISPKLIKFSTLDQLGYPHYVAKAITAFFALIPLLVIHGIAASLSVKHREEILLEKDVPAPSTVALSVTVIVTAIYIAIFYYVYRYKRQQFDSMEYIMHCITSLSIAYIGHFIPFISLGFIQDPLKTAIIIAGELLLVICVYGVVLVIVYSKNAKSLVVFLDALAWILSSVIVIAAMVIVLTLFSLGSFNDFDDIQDLLFPLIGTVGTLLLGYYLKPTFEGEEDEEDGAANTTTVVANTTTVAANTTTVAATAATAAEHQEMSIKKDDTTTL